MAINIKYIVLFIFFTIPIFVSVAMIVFDASSMMSGTLFFSSLFFSLHILNPTKIYFPKDYLLIYFAILFFIFLISTLSFVQNPLFEYGRFFGSYFLIIYLVFVAFLVSVYLKKIESLSFYKTINSIFYILLFDGIYSTIKYVFVGEKETILFSEPSHFALVVLPFFLFKLVSNKQAKSTNFFIIISMVLIAFYIQNLTLLVGIVLSIFIISKFKYFSLSLLILILFIIFFPAINLDYFLSRLTFSGEITNLSTLVFLSGWERALLNFQNTFGLGIGLNQLGFVGATGNFRQILSNLGMAGLNIYDGGSTASKLISELGFLGLFATGIYLFSFFKFNILMKRYIIFLDSKDIFFLSMFIIFSIELFIRGVGYFSPTVFLVLVSIFYINKITYKKIKEINIEAL